MVAMNLLTGIKRKEMRTKSNENQNIRDMNFPGSNLHKLSGDREGFWSVSVSGNWRVIFRFEDGDVYDVDYLDYH